MAIATTHNNGVSTSATSVTAVPSTVTAPVVLTATSVPVAPVLPGDAVKTESVVTLTENDRLTMLMTSQIKSQSGDTAKKYGGDRTVRTEGATSVLFGFDIEAKVLSYNRVQQDRSEVSGADFFIAVFEIGHYAPHDTGSFLPVENAKSEKEADTIALCFKKLPAEIRTYSKSLGDSGKGAQCAGIIVKRNGNGIGYHKIMHIRRFII